MKSATSFSDFIMILDNNCGSKDIFKLKKTTNILGTISFSLLKIKILWNAHKIFLI